MWRERGACKGLDPQIFYPETDEDADTAKRVCAQCHVQTACLEYALQFREKRGRLGRHHRTGAPPDHPPAPPIGVAGPAAARPFRPTGA